MNPRTATASTPFPPRFSANMNDSSAAHITAKPDVSFENFFIPLKNISPTTIPAPIPTSICVSMAAKCTSSANTLCPKNCSFISNNMNGSSTIIGVLRTPSIFRNSSTLFDLLWSIMNTDAGSVPDIIDANTNE